MYLWHTEGTLSPLNNVLYRYLLSTGYVNYVPSFTQKILRCCYAGFLSHINKNTTHTLSLSLSLIYNEITKKPVVVCELCAIFLRPFKCLYIKCSWHHVIFKMRSFKTISFYKKLSNCMLCPKYLR